MKRICKIIACLGLLGAVCLPLRASLKEDVEHLSDPLLEGRRPGTRGSVEASVYIMRRFQQIGLQPKLQFFLAPAGIGRNIYSVCRQNPKSDKYVLICAHYDGLGVIGDNLYPCADSNASGVAVMLYLSESLSDSGCNYIFAALDVHDGLAGAENLAGLPYKISMVVNIDTIGSTLAPPNKYRPDFLIALGGKEYEKQFDKANEGPKLRLYYDYYRSKGFTDYFYTRISDQAPFLQRKIKAVMFTSGITMNTNKPSDTAQTLDYEVLERRAILIHNWVLSL